MDRSDDTVNDPRYLHLRAKIQRRMDKAYVRQGTDWSEVWAGLGLIAVALAPAALARGNLSALQGWPLVLMAIAGGAGLIFLWGGIVDRDDEKPLDSSKSDGVSIRKRG